MGNSMGATNAFRFAARYPDRVRALINEEGPAEEQNDLAFVHAWSGTFATREELAETIGERLFWSVEPSLRHTPKGWTLVYTPEEILEIAAVFNGDWWSDWLATACPALAIRGTDSRAVEGSVMEAMARRRPNSRIAVLDAGHVAHEENPDAFLAAVEPFLAGLT
jgi:pimeloyl-ACP methyl ester carboxylesterase